MKGILKKEVNTDSKEVVTHRGGYTRSGHVGVNLEVVDTEGPHGGI